MSLRRSLRRASNLAILGICMQFAGSLQQGGLLAQTAGKAGDGSGMSAEDKQKIGASAIKMPLFFEANEGQTDPSVRFLTRSGGYTMFLTPTETVLAEGKNGIVSGEKFGKGLEGFRADAKNAKQTVLRMELLGANSAPEFKGLQELPGKVNYLIGNDPSAWHTNVALFSEVQVAKVYPGVDLLFHGDQRRLEYDFIVAPGADPGRIGFKIRGAKKIEIAADGDLILHTADSEFEMRKPLIYQGEGASRREVQGRFVLSAKNQVRFEVGPYDHAEKLVIDPAIGYATFLGGSGDDEPTDLAVDSSVPSSPKVYVAGFSSSITTFPAVLASKTSTIATAGGATYGFIAMIDPTITSDPGGASSLDYLTFIGGSTPSTGTSPCTTGLAKVLLDSSQGISSIQAVVTGITSCSDYPGTKIQTITGSVAAVVTRLATSGAAIDVSVLLGGNGEASGAFGSVDSSGNVLIASATSSTNLPTTTGAYMTEFNNGGAGTFDCYIAKLPRATFNPPSYLTYLNTGGGSTAAGGGGAGSGVGCGAIEDSTGKIDAGGNTVSATAFHVGAGGANLANGFQTTFNGTQDTFAMRLDPTLSGTAELLYATYYGGGGVTNATNGALDLGNGVVAIGGYTKSATTGPTAPDIPLKNAYQSTNLAAPTGGETGYLVVVDTTQPGAESLLCSTYFGGSSGSDEVHAVTYDASDPTAFRIILGGQAQSAADFPTKNSIQSFQGVQDGYIASLKVPAPGQNFAASLYFSSYIGGGAQSSGESERILGVGVDANDTIYATGRTISADFFANVTPPVSVNGFQTSCSSCGAATPLDDVVVFSITGAPSATLQSITVTPASASIAGGASQQFRAEGFYSDGSIQDITNTVVWVSSNTGIARMSSVTPGLATGFGAGVATITATFNTVASNVASLTVTTTAFAFNVVLEGTAYGTVTDNLGQINCTNNTGQGMTGSCNTSYPSGTTVVLMQTANPGSVFASWGVPIGDAKCSGTTSTCTFTMDEQEEIAATFNNGAVNFTLSVIPGGTATGGGIVTGAGSIACTMNGTSTPAGTCSASVKSGSIETLTAEQNATSNFTGWSGSCVVPAGQPAKCVVTMSAAETITAVFTVQSNPFSVTVTGNGTVTSTSTPTVPTEIDCANPTPPSACSTNFTSGTSVSLTATPATGYSFTNWTAGPCGGSSINPCIFTVSGTSRTSATALFTVNTYLLTVNRAGTLGGTITSNVVNGLGGSITCGPAAGIAGCSVFATYNTPVVLTETPPSGGGFGGWGGAPTACTISGATCTFNMPAAAETVTATFTTESAPTAPTLSITKTHTGGFTLGQSGATYTVTVSNAAGAAATSGPVLVWDGLPPGLSLDSMAGTGWTCTAWSCTRSDALAGGASYPPITVTVEVSDAATSPQLNTVTVNGGGSLPASATDSTTITGGAPSRLIVADFNVYGEGDEDKQRIDGTSKPLQIGLTNTSTTQTVTFSGVTPTSPYTATTDCKTLAPGQQCHVFVSFPATTVCQNMGGGTITVADNDPGGSLVLDIQGWGADTVIQVDDLTDSTLTPTALAQSLVGTGVAISNVTYTGAKRAAGKFTSSSNILGFTNGIVLSNGSARNVAGTNCEDGMSVDNGEPGDADLDTIVGAGSITNDAAVLQFDFVPTSSSINFQYVFSSEEYPDYIGLFNDVFGFFLTAPGGTPVNLALIPGTDLPVSINNVNDGNPSPLPPIPPANPQFYVNNQVYFAPPPAPLPPVDAEPNGLTTVLTAAATVIPGQTYHIKLAIGDANDFALDSNVFVQAGSLSSTAVTATPATLAFGSQAQGTTSASQPVTIANVGTTTVTITSIAASTNYTETNDCPATLITGTTTGSSCSVNVSFAPTATGTLTGTVTVTYTSSGSTTPQTTTVTLSGTGTAATSGTISISPTSLTFGSQAVGTTSATQTVTVSNTGGAAVTFTSIVISGDFAGATLAQCPSIAVEGTPCTFQISFKPTATGTRTGAITFTDNATGSPQSVMLTGTGTGATGTITITPTSLGFGDVGLLTTSAAKTVTVSNTGGTAVTFTSIVTSGDFAGATLAQCPSIAVEGTPCTFSITFTPTATGTRTGTITFTDNATGSPQTVTLTGTGVAATIGISPTSLTFGSQVVGTTSASQTVTVSNNGAFPLKFSNIAMSGDFAGATLAQCPSIGEEAPACTFSITFTPTATGTRTGAITFTDNATGSPQTVTLTGTGTSAAATVTVTPGSLTFGSQTVSTTSAGQTVTVKNTGTASVNISALGITGNFAIATGGSGACSSETSLAGGASCTIGVTFTPTEAGTATGTLSVTDNATGSPQMVALSGTGVTSSVIITVAPGGSTTATTVSGGTAYYGLMITGAPGVTGTVQLGCVPSSVLITCKVIPGTVTLNGSSVEVAFAIQTFCQGSTTATGFAPPVGGIGGGLGLLLVTMVLGGAVWTFRRNRRVALTFATLLLVALGSAACNSLPSGPNGATPAGTYSLSLTTTLNGQTQTLPNFLTLVVK
jgi:hypothetical protein